MRKQQDDLHLAAGALRLLQEFGRSLEGRGLSPQRRAAWSGALTRLGALLEEFLGPGTGAALEQPAGNGLAAPPPQATLAQGELVTDRLGVIAEASQGAAELLRVRRAFLLGKPLPLFVSEGQRGAFYSLLSQLLISPTNLKSWCVRLRPVRGVLVNVWLSVRAVETGELHWELRDAEPALQAERALLQERDFTDSLMDTAQAVILVLDEGARIVRCNPYARNVSGYGDGELRGQDWSVLFPPAQQPAAASFVAQALTFGVSRNFTAPLRARAGAPRLVAWSARLLPGGAGPGVLVLGQDITELEQAQQRAVEAERLAAIGQVTAALAHESRNLVQAAQACLERLSWRLAGQEEALDLVRRAQNTQRGLTRLFEDVRAYGAPLLLECAPCNLSEVWRATWEGVRSSLPDREAELREEVHEGLDLWCSADCFRLGQVFRNILENSFAAATGPGAVRITVEAREANLGARPALRVAVRDNGPGLDAEQRQRIFEAFYTTRPRGTGLGMAIARRIMEAHGGQIGLGDSGPGAEIVLLLPRSQS